MYCIFSYKQIFLIHRGSSIPILRGIPRIFSTTFSGLSTTSNRSSRACAAVCWRTWLKRAGWRWRATKAWSPSGPSDPSAPNGWCVKHVDGLLDGLGMGLLGWWLMTGIIPENSLRLAPVNFSRRFSDEMYGISLPMITDILDTFI